MKYLLSILLVFSIYHCKEKQVIEIKPNEIVEEEQIPILYSVLFREGVVLNKTYICPSGKLTDGAGNTRNPKGVKTVEQAILSLQDTIKIYKEKIEKRWPHLNQRQVYAVISLAMNCYDYVGFNSSFSRALDKQKTPDFTIWCKYTKEVIVGSDTIKVKVKSQNLLQSRRYEQALFNNDSILVWNNPYRNYSNEETTLENLQDFYKQHWEERIIN